MSKPRRRKRPEEPEEHENHERWLVSYADMITVLMALFIVLFAMSSVDETKFLALKESLASSFGNPITAVQSGKSPAAGETANDGALDVGAVVPATSKQPSKEIAEAVSAAKSRDARKAADDARANVEREVRTLEAVRQALEKALADAGMSGSARFRYDERGLVVSLVTDKVLFASDRAELSQIGFNALDAFGPVLRALPNDLLIEGHTNTVAAAPKYFKSEWELSSARAATVVRHLIHADRVAPHRLSATGYADQRPLIRGTSDKANRLNRRVEIVVASTLPPEESALLAQIAPTVTNKRS
jgi:chemotaxis protein MotB